MHPRLQDFKTVTEYNSAVFRITSQLKLCGEKVSEEDMLEKTFSTFHASNVLLQQQYREKGFKKYSDLISCLLVAEQNNELLMKNHEVRPTGAAPFPEVNAATHGHYRQTRGRGRGHGRGHRQGRGRGRANHHGRGNFKNSSSHQRWKNEKNEKEKVDKAAKLMRIFAIVVVTKVIGLVPVVPQNILLTFTNVHLKRKRLRLILLMRMVTSIIIWILLT
jgi:hypothetical protein